MSVSNDTIWVIDTSSIIAVKEFIQTKNFQIEVFGELTSLCERECLVYPPEVVTELEEGIKEGSPDRPLLWARQNRAKGCRLGRCYDHLKSVMNHAVAQLTPDPNKTHGKDDADPHVLATALEVAATGSRAVIITQESRKPYPTIPLNVAAGALGFPSINLYAFLIEIEVWKEKYKNPNIGP